ncbi:[acyl-carrier-protein] S-malonyltransferase [Methylohalomonas lacus]|uniref:Malonyl CoA-acyl carrier protein transacylase n=1 Tax=Methylohalomonas lacus TaxID=398773 RepID=A0AAE3L3R9_9GAMM|nr:ACP S-malonyltransferase [Methylohalomonas lacus]MCS3902633.1 [acyl-carrier-protein] S-malonyltransferase [Methylohalomonas lacus]
MALAFVFPGQGSQSVGMLADLQPVNTIIHKTFAEASEVLGYDLWQLVQNGPEDELNDTRRTQPAMLTAGIAVWRLWQARDGARPDYLAGHSLGEYTALAAAGALTFASAVKLVEQRGEFMQSAVPAGGGAMAAILGLDDAQVAAVCEQAAGNGHVAPANFNAPGQVVIAGDHAAVERAIEAARDAGAKRAVALPVSVPSHCELMRPAAEQLDAALASVDIQSPAIPVVHNADVSMHSDPAAIRTALVEQLYRPVRWVETIQILKDKGVQGVVECGPGKVLAGLGKRIDRSLPIQAIHDAASFEAVLNPAT